MATYPNVTEVRTQARTAWEARQKQRQSRIERISSSIDFWIVLIVLSFVMLSIPHTMRVFDMITPTLGKGAFVGLELGLLYRSFRGKLAAQKGESLPHSLVMLAWLLFVSLVVANGVGAFIAIADANEAIADKPLSDLVRDWPSLPARAQIALVLVPLAALMIPVGTIVGGEGLAALFLDVRSDGNPLDDLWAQVGQDIEFTALRDAAINAGHTPRQANRWAAEVIGLDTPGQVSDRSRAGQKTDKKRTGAGMGATDAVLAYLDATGRSDLSVRTLADLVSDEYGVSVSKTTAGAARNQWQASRNGHKKEGAYDVGSDGEF